MTSDAPLSFNQAVRGISEFIEVAIHNILYSRHPGLNDYISGAVKAVSDELAVGNVDKVIMVIKNKEEVPLERYIFAIQNMIQVEHFNKETSVEEAMTASTLGHYFRSFLVKLSMIESELGQYPLPDDLSFAIILELKDDKAPTVPQGKDPPPWVPASTQHTTAGASEGAELHMLRAVDTGIISLSLAVQESEQKLELEKQKNSKGKQKAT
ncbi:unnamed protein product [Somion occarium]|uniref:HORMA domain-containing protein n=1 Tax=Somion occarium TaxID=3059160 RepID=A0ABP1CH00_9APHY